MSHLYKEFALGALIGSLAGATTSYFLQTKSGRDLKNEVLKNMNLPDWAWGNGDGASRVRHHAHAAATSHPVRKIKRKAKKVKKAAAQG